MNWNDDLGVKLLTAVIQCMLLLNFKFANLFFNILSIVLWLTHVAGPEVSVVTKHFLTRVQFGLQKQATREKRPKGLFTFASCVSNLKAS
jgi:hypothetical protein